MVITTKFKHRNEKKTQNDLKPLRIEIEITDRRWKYVGKPYTQNIKPQTIFEEQ